MRQRTAAYFIFAATVKSLRKYGYINIRFRVQVHFHITSFEGQKTWTPPVSFHGTKVYCYFRFPVNTATKAVSKQLQFIKQICFNPRTAPSLRLQQRKQFTSSSGSGPPALPKLSTGWKHERPLGDTELHQHSNSIWHDAPHTFTFCLPTFRLSVPFCPHICSLLSTISNCTVAVGQLCTLLNIDLKSIRIVFQVFQNM